MRSVLCWLSGGVFIAVQRSYTAEELFGLMQQNLGDKYGLLKIEKLALFNKVALDGVKGYKIYVGSSGNAVFGRGIMISQMEIIDTELPSSVSEAMFSVILYMFQLVCLILTLGASYWLPRLISRSKNMKIMKALRVDLERLIKTQ